MRIAFALIMLAAPVGAWEFTPGLPCLLSHDGQDMAVELTHDPTRPYFTITPDARPHPWPDGAVFSIRFDGPAGLTISTNRHQISNQGRSLTVGDTGFSNVLAGLERNEVATALIGDDATRFSLSGAAEPVRAFRECRADPAV